MDENLGQVKLPMNIDIDSDFFEELQNHPEIINDKEYLKGLLKKSLSFDINI
ncbi:hypothetical protein [Apilactobacillus timberlakei]|uniref:hypothetical protein n=1 Tax=Apilactobacillus timberlakei TaxID=2008380 RepID=UPI0015E87482|nr:hypothetical protein [Apilactobacillus timberlakei]